MTTSAFQRAARAIGAAAALTLAGCGGGGSGTAVVTPPAAPALSATAAAFLNLDLSNLVNYAATLPTHYDAAVVAQDNAPPGVATNNPVAMLGRVLFYDKRLSVNDTISCASCHQQAQGFSDSARFSVGFAGTAFTTAHSSRLGNVRYYRPGSMFWDKRAASLEAQASQPIQHPVEMGFDAAHGGLAALFVKMQGLVYYPELFTFAFGDNTITEARIQQALAQFQRAMVSTNSRWDTAYAQVYTPVLPDKGLDLNAPGLTPQENRGRHLFVAGPGQGGLACAACHVPPSFGLAANSLSNGLDAGETTIFKSPSLKSVGRSGAFMHDGRFSSIEQVVEHYNSGVRDGPALDNRLRGSGGAPRVLNLPDADKAALAAFLRTLDDTVLATDPRFATPFKVN